MLLHRLHRLLCVNEVGAIYIGPSSRTFTIKNESIRVHLTAEEHIFGLLSMQLDRVDRELQKHAQIWLKIYCAGVVFLVIIDRFRLGRF